MPARSGSLLRVDGPRLVDGTTGEPVVLRGYNAGGWLNMENFLTGYPGTESQHRKALRRALGPELYDLFFDEFLSVFFADADVAYLASLGLNSVRIPFNYRHFEADDAPFELKEAGFARLEGAVQSCQRHGVYAILDFHALPGAQNQHWHSDNGTNHAAFWEHRHFQDRAVHLWEALAQRFRGNPAVAGYNVMNEPGDVDGDKLKPFYDRAVAAIRAVDPDHVIFLDGNRYSTDFSVFDPAELYPNTVYAAHDYARPGFIDGGPYPGVSRGVYVDRAEVEKTFLSRTEFMRDTATPIWIGEFGPLYTGDPDQDNGRYQLLADQLEIYAEYGASWSIWAYKDIGGQGLVSAAPDSPWRQRVAGVVAKKARLGVDSWGSRDTGVRHIMTPIEETFAREYPGFDPFPFGQASWLMTLVRSIVLAEPMLDDFERAFAGITDPATVVELADSFRLDRCVVRQRLADILSAAARQPERDRDEG